MSFKNKLESPIYEICSSLYGNGCNKLILEYISSLRDGNGTYYMFFECSENDDEYILISDEFISLKNINNFIKECALKQFHTEGGVVAEYGVFEK